MIQHVHELFLHVCAMFGRGSTANVLCIFQCVFCLGLAFKTDLVNIYRNRHVQINMEVPLNHQTADPKWLQCLQN